VFALDLKSAYEGEHMIFGFIFKSAIYVLFSEKKSENIIKLKKR
jgi:hypothetical protein